MNDKLPFGFATPQQSPGFMLWQTTTLWQKNIKKALEPFGISHAQFVILANLLWLTKHNYQPTQVMLAHWTKLEKMNVSKLLKELSRLQLVTRSEHHEDSRAKNVAITKKGRDLLDKAVPIVEQVDQQFFSPASILEQNTFLSMCAKLNKGQNDE